MVTVTIRRDTTSPKFQHSSYRASLTDLVRVDSGVNIQPGLRATDRDNEGKIKYEILGVLPAPQFFKINPDTAQVRISTDLRQDSLKTMVYSVSVILETS